MSSTMTIFLQKNHAQTVRIHVWYIYFNHLPIALPKNVAAELSHTRRIGTDLGPPTLGWVAIRVDALTLAVSVHDHRRHLFFQDRQHLRQKTGDTVDNLLKNHMRNWFSAPNLELDIHDHPFHPFAMRIFWAIIPFWNFPTVLSRASCRMIRDIDVSEGLIGGGFPCTEPVGCHGMPTANVTEMMGCCLIQHETPKKNTDHLMKSMINLYKHR